jgi:hypothetical protein
MRTCLIAMTFSFGALAALAAPAPRSPEYEAVQQRLARGWNTWDVHSVTAHVLLPEGFTLRLGLKHNSSLNSDAFLAEALIGRRSFHGEEVETVFPGSHAADGRYSELRLSWRGHEVQVQSAHAGSDLVVLVTPLAKPVQIAPSLVLSAGVLWNRPGSARRDGSQLTFVRDQLKIPVFWTAREEAVVDVPLANPYLAAPLAGAIGISTGQPRSLEEIRSLVAAARPKATGLEQAIESVIGWDTIYEPSRQRVVSPVSRLWCVSWGGYVLFDWDTYFAASLAATASRDLAYANAVEITREATPAGFVPNYARAGDWKSFDRSEPPVGAITLLSLYRQFGEAWPLRDTFDGLLTWNRWWNQHRDVDGYLVWATDAGNRPVNPDDTSVGTKQGAMYESGLDNSPMFDGATFDPATHRLLQADAGLMGLYVADCDALAEIATILGRTHERDELLARSNHYRARLQTLWDEAAGIFVNRDVKTGAASARISPTNFYPLLARAATPPQAARMIREQLLNPERFGGRWMLPAISRSDPAFKDQEYWRGRVWGPMNYLVYLGLQSYDAPAARRELADKSRALFELEWREHGHVHENYNATTGSGDDVTSSDRFYHWGALLALISLMEERQAPPILPPQPAAAGR